MRTLLRSRRSGFTLVETLVSVGVLGLVLSGVVLFQIRGNAAFRAASQDMSLHDRAQRTLDRLAAELAIAGRATLVPDPVTEFGAAALDFRAPSGLDAGGNVTWSTLTTLRLELEPGEADDGVDNDGDGVVDERRLVLVRDSGGVAEQRTVLCTSVREMAEDELDNAGDDNGNGVTDEAGFNVVRVGDALTIRLTLEDRNEQGDRSIASVVTSLVLRN